MDNRLTRKRLSDFLAYEWIMMLVVCAIAIVLWEFAYSVFGVRLSVGQQFKYYLDEDLSVVETYSVYDVLGVEMGRNGKTFSYDVMSVASENLDPSYNVLSARLAVQEGDAVFTSSAEKNGSVRAKTIVDQQKVYDFVSLLGGAKDYLKQFTFGDIYDTNNYNEDAIRVYFDKRMQGDNRYRSETEKEKGRQDEIERIKKLAKDVEDFEKILSVEENGLFFKYTKYEQATGGDITDENHGILYAKEKAKGELIYGINFASLTGGKKNASDYLKLNGGDSAENVVLLLFDFSEYQYDLQFESISFVDTLIREFSDILD